MSKFIKFELKVWPRWHQNWLFSHQILVGRIGNDFLTRASGTLDREGDM